MDEPEEYAEVVTEGPLFDRVKAALDEIRPALQEDGGDATLKEIEDGAIAIIQFAGACAGCPMSELTVRYGIETHLRGEVPEILAVEVTAEQGLGDRTFSEVLERATFTPLQLG